MGSDDSYKKLGADIVIHAVNDFRKAAKIIKAKKGNVDGARKEIAQILLFIQSEWFHTFSSYNQDLILKKLMEELDESKRFFK